MPKVREFWVGVAMLALAFAVVGAGSGCAASRFGAREFPVKIVNVQGAGGEPVYVVPESEWVRENHGGLFEAAGETRLRKYALTSPRHYVDQQAYVVIAGRGAESRVIGQFNAREINQEIDLGTTGTPHAPAPRHE